MTTSVGASETIVTSFKAETVRISKPGASQTLVLCEVNIHGGKRYIIICMENNIKHLEILYVRSMVIFQAKINILIFKFLSLYLIYFQGKNNDFFSIDLQECPTNVCGIDCKRPCHCLEPATMWDTISGICETGCYGRYTGVHGLCDIGKLL